MSDDKLPDGFKLPNCAPGHHVISCANINHGKIEKEHIHAFTEPVMCQCVAATRGYPILDETAPLTKGQVDVIMKWKENCTGTTTTAGTPEVSDFFFNVQHPMFSMRSLYEMYLQKKILEKSSNALLDEAGFNPDAVNKAVEMREQQLAKKTLVWGRSLGKSTTLAKAALDVVNEAPQNLSGPDPVMTLIAESLNKVNLELGSFGFCEKSGDALKINSMRVHRPEKVTEALRASNNPQAEMLANSYVDDFSHHLRLNTGIKLIAFQTLDIGIRNDTEMSLINCTFILPETLPVVGVDLGAEPSKTVFTHVSLDRSGNGTGEVLGRVVPPTENPPMKMAWGLATINAEGIGQLTIDEKKSAGWKGPDESKSLHQNAVDFFTTDAREMKK